MRFEILAVVALIAGASAIGIGRTQSSGARGVLMCNERPAAHVTVKLYDDDRGTFTV